MRHPGPPPGDTRVADPTSQAASAIGVRAGYLCPMPIWAEPERSTRPAGRAPAVQMLPSGEGTPGAEEAGAAEYIDGFLGAFTFDPARWAGGPTSGRSGRGRLATFHRWLRPRRAGLAHAARGLPGEARARVQRSGLWVSRSGTGRVWPRGDPTSPRWTGVSSAAGCARTGSSPQSSRGSTAARACTGAPEYGGNRDTVRLARRSSTPETSSPGAGATRRWRGRDRRRHRHRVRARVGPRWPTCSPRRAGPSPSWRRAATISSIPTTSPGPPRDYSNDEIKFISRHFLGPDPLIEPRTFRRWRGGGRARLRRRGQLHPHHRRRGRDPCGREGAALPGGGFALLSTLRAAWRAPRWRTGRWPTPISSRTTPRPSGRSAWRARRAPIPLPRGGPGPTRCRRVRRCTGRCCRCAAAEELGLHPYEAPTGGELRALRRPPGLQQLRVLCLLRLPDSRQG